MSELILATSHSAWRYAALGAPGSEIRELPMRWTAARVKGGEEFLVAGWWGRLGPLRAAVFIRNGELRVAIDRGEWPLDASLTCRLTGAGGQTELRLQVSGIVVASCSYPTPEQPRQHWLEWPLDREDWDFGCFIASMIERRLEDPPLETIWPFPRHLRPPMPLAVRVAMALASRA